MKAKEKEKRQHFRLAVPMTVEIAHRQLGSLQLETADLSDGGLFLKATPEQCPPLNDEITLQVVGTLDGKAPPLLSARVVRITDEGMGVQFL